MITVRSVVQHGQGPMPAFSQLSDADDWFPAGLSHSSGVLRRLRGHLRRLEPRPVDPLIHAEYKSSFGFMFARNGLPVITPPWTTLTAYDLNQGNDSLADTVGGGTLNWQRRVSSDTGSHFPKVSPVLTAGAVDAVHRHTRPEGTGD